MMQMVTLLLLLSLIVTAATSCTSSLTDWLDGDTRAELADEAWDDMLFKLMVGSI